MIKALEIYKVIKDDKIVGYFLDKYKAEDRKRLIQALNADDTSIITITLPLGSYEVRLLHSLIQD